MKKFVKLICFVTIFMLICTMMFGCGNDTTTNETLQETKPTTLSDMTSESEYAFTQAPSRGNEIEGYRKDRLNHAGIMHMTREEEKFLESNGLYFNMWFELDTYWYGPGILVTYSDPVVYQSDNGIEVWGINEYGELCAQSIVGQTSKNSEVECYGLVHYTAQEGEEIIGSNTDSAVSYEKETGMVKSWQFGELDKQAQVPANSMYVGLSHDMGFLFKDGTDVYAVKNFNGDRDYDVEIIAHNVQFVITTSYQVNDRHAQPLFLMTDGTLKRYEPFDSVDMDNEANLMDVQSEGGYDVTNAEEREAWNNRYYAFGGALIG